MNYQCLLSHQALAQIPGGVFFYYMKKLLKRNQTSCALTLSGLHIIFLQCVFPIYKL